MLNNIQIYHIKAENPMINTSIGKQTSIAKENKRLVGLFKPADSVFGFLTVKYDH